MFIGLLWWAITKDASTALPLALFFELFWLDLYPIGGFIPPMPAFPYLLLLLFGPYMGWESPFGISVFPLALSLPFAHVVPLLEMELRSRQKTYSVKMLDTIEYSSMPVNMPGRILGKAISLHLLFGITAFVAACLGIAMLAPILHEYTDLDSFRLSWGAVAVIAALGAVVGLRIRRIYMAAIVAVFVVMAFKLL